MSKEEGMTLKEVFEFFAILIILAVVSAIDIIMIIIGQILDFFRGKEEKWAKKKKLPKSLKVQKN